MTTSAADRLRQQFGHLAAGDARRFVDGCADDVTVTVRGTVPLTTILSRPELPAWIASQFAMIGTTLRIEIALVAVHGHQHLVVLRHEVTRAGVTRSYETVNFCSFRDDQLAAWFVHPTDLWAYAAAWGIPTAPAVALAGSVGSA